MSAATDFSKYSKEELLCAISELQQENIRLKNDLNTPSAETSKSLSFRHQYAEKILDALPDMLAVLTDDGTTVAVVSSEETNNTGISREDISGIPVSQFLPEHVCKQIMKSIDQAIKYGKSESLSHLMYVDNKPHYFENRTVRIDNDCNLCLCRDITEEVLAKIQLESLSYAVNLINENIFSLNHDGVFLFANKQFLKDHRLKEAIGKSAIGILFSCKNGQDWGELKQRVHDNNGEVNYVHEHFYNDNSRISFEIVVRSVRNLNDEEEFWFFARNVTQRLEQEREITELDTLMNAILSNIPTYLFVKDTTDFKYLYWNKALVEHTGISSQQAVGKTDSELFPSPVDAYNFRQNDIDLVKTNNRAEYIEEFINTNGDKRIVKTVKVPIARDSKHPLILGVALDITDLKLVEEQLIAAKQEADKSNQLKSAFLANMSHEIRTPLNAIVGFAKLIMTEEDLDTQQEYSNIIDRNADLLLHLINDILDLSKIEAGTLDFVIKDISLHELCSDMLEVHRLKTPEGVTLVYETNDKDLIIESDRNRLSQVFTNLLSNAIKFTPAGEIRFGYSLVGNTVEAFVRDSGMGISSETLPTIFDRFIKLNSFVAGTGLGLSITRTIIERLGGTIVATSEEGKGTEFRFTLPYRNSSDAKDRNISISEISKISTVTNASNKSILPVKNDD